jgi:choline dehydrogenase
MPHHDRREFLETYDDVVGADLRVRGVDGLRVADISVLPRQVAGNTAAQAMAIGWLAADVIRSS